MYKKIVLLFCFIVFFTNTAIEGQNLFYPGDSIAINLSGYTEGLIQWQYSLDNEKWEDLSNENGLTLNRLLDESASYRACVSNCDKVYFSDTTKIHVANSDYDYVDYIGSYLANDDMKGRYPGTKEDTLSMEFISKLYSLNNLKCFNDTTFSKPFITSGSSIPERNGIPTFNIIGVKSGNDPVLKDEFIVVSAHYDHIGIRNGKIINGADDNASGVTCLALLLKMFKEIDTKRSILFITTGAEEFGCMGMKAFYNSNMLKTKDIKCVYNYDMVGRMRDNSLYVYGRDKFADNVKKIIASSNSESLNILYDTTVFFKGSSSDHTVYWNSNIPSLGITTGTEPEYHTPDDDWNKININGILKIASLSFRVLENLANK